LERKNEWERVISRKNWAENLESCFFLDKKFETKKSSKKAQKSPKMAHFFTQIPPKSLKNAKNRIINPQKSPQTCYIEQNSIPNRTLTKKPQKKKKKKKKSPN
jgi:hypothetical protein